MNAATATLDPSAPGAATAAPGAADATASTALTTGPSRAVEHIRNAFEQPTVRKALPAVVVFALIVVLALAYSWMQAPQYRAVMPGMQEADLQNAYDALKQGGFSPQLDEVTGQLKVTQDQYHQARIYLAGQGIPKNLPSGLDALSTENSMTTSQFMEQARYNAMMEQELARSVAQIAGVRHARVHLATPKQSVFVRDRTPPKASVVITRYPGRMITEQQVQAIVHLVSFSVPYMAPEHVTVVDNFGSLMTRTPDLNALGLTEAQSQHKAQLEELYRERIVQILNPVVGETNVRSQVNLTLDFTEIERTTEDYDNNQKGPKTRSEVLAEDRNANQVAAGVPGSTTNVPPPNAAATQNTNVNGAEGQTEAGGVLSSRTTRNYELDRSVQRVKRATGTVQRVSVAVVINERKAPVAEGEEPAPGAPTTVPYTEDELERMQNLVQGVIGFDAARGDSVSIMPTRFESPPPLEPLVPWYQDDSVINAFKLGLVTLVLLSFMMLVVRPVIRALTGADQAEQTEEAKKLADGELTEEDMQMIQLGEGESLEDIKAKLKPKKSSISADMLDTANTYDDKVALIRMLVAEDSARVANVLKRMIQVT